MYQKNIVYDRETRDYAMYLDDELVGYARTYHEAEVTLDQLVFELLGGEAMNANITSLESLARLFRSGKELTERERERLAANGQYLLTQEELAQLKRAA